MATLGTLQQVGQCNSSVFKLGSLAVGAGPNAAIGGTFEVLTELDATYRVGLNFSRLHEAKKVLVSARSGVLCSAIGEFPWLLHDIKITPQVADCPIPAGKYTVEGFRFDNDRFKFYERGNYEISMQLFRDEKLICGAKVDMHLV